VPATERVAGLFAGAGIALPTQDDWRELKASVMEHGIFNRNLQAVPPTGSISYINNSTSSIHPVASKIEIRKEGKLGRVYYPAPYLTNENLEYYEDAYEIGYEKIIDTYAAATQHVDQGLSLTLFFKDTATTRDLNRAQIYAWTKGIKTIYYIRLRQLALEGTEVEGCVDARITQRELHALTAGPSRREIRRIPRFRARVRSISRLEVEPAHPDGEGRRGREPGPVRVAAAAPAGLDCPGPAPR